PLPAAVAPSAGAGPVATLPPAVLRQTPSPAPGEELVVKGSVTYRQRVALPPQAMVIVQLVETGRDQSPGRVLIEERIATGGRQVPFTYALRVPLTAVSPKARLILQARIEVDGAVRFANTARTAVPRTGSTRPIEIVVTPVK
ncbi:MAG: YbaY family lipoprotein, partial [bacterium]